MERRLSGPNKLQLPKRLSNPRVSSEDRFKPPAKPGDFARRPLGKQSAHAYAPNHPSHFPRRLSAERVAKASMRVNRARSLPPPAAPRRSSASPPPHVRSIPITSGSKIEINGCSIEVAHVIGKGGYSQVYQATMTPTKQDCALKVVNLKAGSDEERKNLIGEVALLKSLKDVDHVVQLIACDVSATEALIVLELGQCDLRHILTQRNRMIRPLDLDFVRYWGGEVLKCIAAVHSHNIVHADLKPANFLVVETGLKIIDFGIANTVPDYTTSVHRNTQVGTVMYMAPETLWRSDGGSDYKVTKASDLWSGGLILYEMVYQRSPFSFDQNGVLLFQIMQQPINHPKLAPGNVPVPIALHEVINSCLDRDPQKRPTAREALESLFFSPISIDWQGLNSLMQSAFRFGQQQANHRRSSENSDAKLEKLVKDAVNDAWKKLITINRGSWSE